MRPHTCTVCQKGGHDVRTCPHGRPSGKATPGELRVFRDALREVLGLGPLLDDAGGRHVHDAEARRANRERAELRRFYPRGGEFSESSGRTPVHGSGA